MKAIELSVKLYKYGEYRETLTHSFDSDEQLKEWVKSSIKESNFLKINFCDDECEKWEQEFEYYGNNYRLYIDL